MEGLTDRARLHAMQDSVDKEKIRKASKYLFEYLAKENFNIFETRYLSASINDVIRHMKRNDSLRLIKEFDYSSSVDGTLSIRAIPNTES